MKTKPLSLIFSLIFLMGVLWLVPLRAQEPDQPVPTVAPTTDPAVAAATPVSAPTVPASATILSNTSTDDSTTWFIEGEPSLVMNGFDLTPLNLDFPVFVEAIRISVAQPVPDISLDAVLYVDPNGGSPVDAQLVRWQTTTINSSGEARIEFPEPVIIEAPVIWAGFYLPVDFQFLADTSGTSVLTYWAWEPGGVFDLLDLSSADVFGPADGSAPVELDMGGVARISVELFNPASDPGALQRLAPLGVQLDAPANAPLSSLISYPFCSEVSYDPDDIAVTAASSFNLTCRTDIPQDSTGLFWNIENVEAGIDSFIRPGRLFDIAGNGDFQAPGGLNTELVVPVTHCLTPDAAYLDTAILAVAYGAPKKWEIMPTARYGNLICAELKHTGQLAYLVPRDPNETSLNANLYFTVAAQVYPSTIGSYDPDEGNYADCNVTSSQMRINIRNDGFELTPATTIRLQDYSVRTDELIQETIINVPIIGPGETITINPFFQTPEVYKNEEHRLVMTLDPGGLVAETNEGDNVQLLSYELRCNN